MSNLNRVGNVDNLNINNVEIKSKEDENIDLSEISFLYETEKLEGERSSFSETYELAPLDENEQGAKFLKGLIDNKDKISSELGLTDEQYDSLACIALALASQETGMGLEDGYVSENTGAKKLLRDVAKWFDVYVRGNGSASSGLTQMKIYDFMNSDKLNQQQKDLLKELGVEAKGVATNNLYSNPDKAAAASVVVLSSILDKYPEYIEQLSSWHKNPDSVFGENMTEEQKIEKGEQILNDVISVYKNADHDTKLAIRNTFKKWFTATPGNKTKELNEEFQLDKLNSLLAGVDSSFSLKQSDLDFIRYALTKPGSEMSETQFCAYGWNKGTGESGMKLDRLLADKIGIILSNPEDFDYDQFTVNVSTLAEKYAQQSVQSAQLAYLDETLNEPT